jgi:uncharacterized protein (TIGR02588 family)
VSSERKTDRPLVEWVAGALSCVLVVSLAGFLLHRALSEDRLTPRLSAAVEAIEQGARGALVRIVVSNDGDATAAAVRVRATRRDDAVGAASEIEFDYLAGRAVRRGAFMMPGTALAPEDIDIEIVGFVEP